VHVLVIPSWYPNEPGDIGGSFFREQAQALVRAGCKVGVIYPQLRSLRQWRTVQSDRYSGITIDDDEGVPTFRSFGTSWFPRAPKLQAAQWVWHGLRLYADYVEKYGRPDVIHAHSLLYAGCLARELGESHACPYVVTEHSSAFVRGRIGGQQRTLARAAARQAQGRFAVSAQFCGFLDNYFGAEASGWMPMPNIVQKDFLNAPLVVKDRVSGFVFLHISLLDTNKSVDNLIRAFADAFGNNAEVTLRIGGNGPERSRLEALAVELGVSHQVQFLNALSRAEVLKHMRRCDAFVLSSKHETFGVVLIEAMAAGKPVIATRCGGPESVVREQDGLLVPVNDVASLAVAMRRMQRDYRCYDPAEIRASCVARFSEQAVTARLVAEYEAVCGSKSHATANGSK